jgi:hypothetical protein
VSRRPSGSIVRYREMARGVTAVSEDALAEDELDEATDKVPATVAG